MWTGEEKKINLLRLKTLGTLIPSVILPPFIVRTKYLVIDPVLSKGSKNPWNFISDVSDKGVMLMRCFGPHLGMGLVAVIKVLELSVPPLTSGEGRGRGR